MCLHDSCEEKPDLLSHQTKEPPVISQSRLYLHSQGQFQPNVMLAMLKVPYEIFLQEHCPILE